MAVIEITVYNSPNIDEAIAESVLNLLGLKTAQIRQEFYSSYSYKNLTEFFKKVVNAPKNAGVFANIAKKLKKNGKMQINFEVDDKVLSDVREFLAVRENKLKNRIIDSDDEKEEQTPMPPLVLSKTSRNDKAIQPEVLNRE